MLGNEVFADATSYVNVVLESGGDLKPRTGAPSTQSRWPPETGTQRGGHVTGRQNQAMGQQAEEQQGPPAAAEAGTEQRGLSLGPAEGARLRGHPDFRFPAPRP